ncbi:sulfurtransferase [Salipaludibacillus keqinensis]|uniref:Sulfurtransferase n=1 Tax=Salipaludibacillus keqinensis TaxID=2045207 RepID=A0A323TGZ3_9BACI|nr:rhodanese-like domain-containing protein [Salipaludibacillus keqinensis]PYZ93556.1 sulfurtransferase [Salipaludibacillus keqinensis]
MSFEHDGVNQVDKEELKKILAQSNPNQVVLDVREPDEYHSGHIPGVPLVPMHTIPNLLDGFDKEKEYIFICRSGNRSQNVSLFMKQQGFDQVTNYDGGMLAWDGDTKEGPEKQITTSDELKLY